MSSASASIFTRLGSMLPWNWAGRRQAGTQQSSGGSGGTNSGVTVDLTNSLSVSAVWSSLKLIAESVGSLPLKCYKIDSKGVRTPYPTHPLAQLFLSKPNRYQNVNQFLETLGFEEGAHGNAYMLIQRVGDRIVGLLPLMADQMTVVMDAVTGDLTYRYASGQDVTVFAESSIWHVKAMGNGITGLSPLAFARESIGLGIAGDRRAAKVAKNGFKPSGVLKFDKALTPAQREALRAEFSDLAQGEDDTVRILEFGMTYEQVSLSPADAQMLETRKFQLSDIARFFAVPTVLIGGTEGSTAWGTGVEAILDGWYRTSLRPRLVRIEQSINNSLVSVSERGQVVFEFDLEALLRMSPAARSTRVKEHVQGGIITPNEGRLEMGYEKHSDPAADSIYMQQQMVRIGTGGGGTPPPAFGKNES